MSVIIIFFLVLSDRTVTISTLTLSSLVAGGVAVALVVFCGVVLCIIVAVIMIKKNRRLTKLNFVKTLNDEDESIEMDERERYI